LVVVVLAQLKVVAVVLVDIGREHQMLLRI
jgi:hypothetical protein